MREISISGNRFEEHFKKKENEKNICLYLKKTRMSCSVRFKCTAQTPK